MIINGFMILEISRVRSRAEFIEASKQRRADGGPRDSSIYDFFWSSFGVFPCEDYRFAPRRRICSIRCAPLNGHGNRLMRE